MPHGQEQVIRRKKVKLSHVMVYSATSPYQGKRERGREGEREGGQAPWGHAVATKLPLGQFWRLSVQELQIYPQSQSCIQSIVKGVVVFLTSSSISLSLLLSFYLSLFFPSLKSAKASINLWSRGILLVLAKVLLKWREIYGWQFVTINQEMLINKVGQLFSWNRGRLCHIVSLIILFIIFD